jgi:hypothetical protein
MRVKGRDNPDYSVEHMDAVDRKDEVETEDKKWYKKLNYTGVDIPIAKRPRGGGARINFFSEGQMPDLAIEIKEGTNGRFKNSNDVHRAAHYIGMYMLREMKLVDNLSEMAMMHKRVEQFNWDLMKQEEIIDLFILHHQRLLTKKITEARLEKTIEIILSGISDMGLREWARDEIREILKSGGNENLLLNRARVNKSRFMSKQAAILGMSVLRDESIE